MLKFWPEFPFVFRNYNREVPTFEQSVDEAKAMLQKAHAKKERRKLKRLQEFIRGGWKHGA